MKEVVSSIRSLGGQLLEETVSSKYLRTLLPIYAIRVLAIQELRCVPGNVFSFEGIIGRLIAFELSNFDNYKLENFESTFKSKMRIKDNKEVKTMKKSGKGKYVSSDISTNEDDVDQLQALLARRFLRGKGKFKGKLSIIYFNCNEIGHIAARCTQKKNYKDGRKFKNKKEDGNKDYKDKGKRCYIVEEDSDENDDEVVYVAMKDESDQDEATALVTYMNKNDN